MNIMFDPVPRSHMFMIDARRMSGSGCCSSTQRAQEPVIVRQRQLIRQPDIYTAADRFWNSRINRNYPHLTRLYLRTYHSSPDYRTIIQAQRAAVQEWYQIYREQHGSLTEEAMNAEIDRIAQQLERTISTFTSGISFNV